jgi:3-hydroxyisobutyrate dehydrogenase
MAGSAFDAADAVGFVGLGNMGRHMARRLAEAGHRLVAYDISEPACAEAASHGIEIAKTPREVADRAAIVFCSLPTPEVVRSVLTGVDGLGGGSRIRLVVELSTVGPAIVEEMASKLAENGITLLDTPVSGGTSGAAAGTLSIIVAGAEAARQQAAPLLALLGRNQLCIGDRPGQAQMAKLANNALFAANLVATLEAMAFGVKGGLAPERLLEVLNASSGRSYVTEQRIKPLIFERDSVVRFSTALLHKDVQLAVNSAREAGAKLLLQPNIAAFLAKAAAEGLADRDCAALVEIFEDWNEISIRATKSEKTA